MTEVKKIGMLLISDAAHRHLVVSFTCASGAERSMSHKHQRTLDAVFTEPVSSNIHWRDIESLLRSLGAQIEPGHGARFRVTLNGINGTLSRPHHTGSASKRDVRHLREFLIQAGIIGHPSHQ